MKIKEVTNEQKIADLEAKITKLQQQLDKKKNAAAKRSAEKQIKVLQNKINQLTGFNDLEIGDWVCNGQPDLAGKIVDLKQEKDFYEAWVLWEGDTVSQPSVPSTLSKQDSQLFTWE